MKSATFRYLVLALPVLACVLAFTVYAQAPSSATSSQGSAEYRNDQFQFSLSYPTDLVVQQQDEQNGAQIISFMNATTGKQFQIEATVLSQQQSHDIHLY